MFYMSFHYKDFQLHTLMSYLFTQVTLKFDSSLRRGAKYFREHVRVERSLLYHLIYVLFSCLQRRLLLMQFGELFMAF